MKHKSLITRRKWMALFSSLLLVSSVNPVSAQTKYRRIRTQYIAALAPSDAKSGSGAETWGLWRVDPGPIGVWLRFYKLLQKAGNIAPAGWRFSIDDWWLDENGLIMKAPEFPMPAGKYYVTNGEEHISLLTVDPPNINGEQTWSLSDNKTIANVTHGPCRSTRYTPENGLGTCSPVNANQNVFPLKPGEDPPPVQGCKRKKYAVLIVFGKPV